MAGKCHAPSHPSVLKNVNINGIYFRDILLIIISRGTNNCSQHSLEEKCLRLQMGNETLRPLWGAPSACPVSEAYIQKHNL